MAGECPSRRWTEGETWTSYYYLMLPGAALNLDCVKSNYELGVQYDYIYRDGKDLVEIPDGARVSLRPVYSISGQVEAEDISLAK